MNSLQFILLFGTIVTVIFALAFIAYSIGSLSNQKTKPSSIFPTWILVFGCVAVFIMLITYIFTTLHIIGLIDQI